MIPEELTTQLAVEYRDLYIKHRSLEQILDRWDSLPQSSCERGLLEEQLKVMGDYLVILAQRAVIENVDVGKITIK